MRESMYISIDFDGTCVEYAYPDVGPTIPIAIGLMRRMNAEGHKLILNTMRTGKELDDAVEWFTKNGIALFAVNCNPDQPKDIRHTVFADLYIDDAAAGCPLIEPEGKRPHLNWAAMIPILRQRTNIFRTISVTPRENHA